jgi:glycosyltransferase involved in cell wall biosynthesis
MERVEPQQPIAVNVRAGPRVLVAIPCYNEELAIAGVVLRSKRFAEEVLVIDDGSKDQTVDVATMAGATVLRNPGNKGKGYGVRRAFQHAHDGGFDALVLIDGDGQHDPDEIPLLLGPILKAQKDVSLGFRAGEKTEMPMWRRMGKRVLDYATAAGGGGVVTDSQCGYRAFGRKAITEMATKLSGDGFSIESEQLVVMNDAKLSFENVEIHCKYEGIDGSTKGPVEHAVGVLNSIFEMVTTKHPMRFIALPSGLLLFGAIALGIHTLRYYNTNHSFLVAYALGSATLAIIGVVGILFAIMLKMVSHVERRIAKRLT